MPGQRIGPARQRQNFILCQAKDFLGALARTGSARHLQSRLEIYKPGTFSPKAQAGGGGGGAFVRLSTDYYTARASWCFGTARNYFRAPQVPAGQFSGTHFHPRPHAYAKGTEPLVPFEDLILHPGLLKQPQSPLA